MRLRIKTCSLAFYPYVIFRMRCDACTRKGSYRTARLAAKFGPETDVEDVLLKLSEDCSWRKEKHSYREGDGCHVYLQDIRAGTPPDLPPGLAPLRVYKGGKADETKEDEPPKTIRKKKVQS